jgi:hypothetical protein
MYFNFQVKFNLHLASGQLRFSRSAYDDYGSGGNMVLNL